MRTLFHLEPVLYLLSSLDMSRSCAIIQQIANIKSAQLFSHSLNSKIRPFCPNSPIHQFESHFFSKIQTGKNASISFFCFLSSEVKSKQLGNARKLNSLVTRLTAQSSDQKPRDFADDARTASPSKKMNYSFFRRLKLNKIKRKLSQQNFT